MDRIRGQNYVTLGGYRMFSDGPPGTHPNAQWFNSIQEEVINVITAPGQLPNEGDDTQMLKSIRALIRQYQPVYSVYDDYGGDMAAALAAVGASPATILVSTSITLAADTVIPATCAVLFMPPGIIYHGGYNLTISGQVIAPANQQIISPSTGTVLFGDQPVYWDWFGTNTAGYNKAFQASRHVRLRSGGAYTLATVTTAVATAGATLLGDGRYEKPRVTYTPAAAANTLAFSGANATIGGFELVGPGAGGAETALAVSGARARVRGLNLANVYTGIAVTADASLEDIYINVCTRGVTATGAINLSIRNAWINPDAQGGNQVGLLMGTVKTLNAIDLHIETADYGVKVDTGFVFGAYCKNCNLIGLHTEDIAINELFSNAPGAAAAPFPMTRFNLVGGHLDATLPAAGHANMICIGAASGTARDTITLMGTSVVPPPAPGFSDFIDDASTTSNSRVHLVNCYLPTKDTMFLSTGNAKVVDLNEMNASQTGILIPGQAVQWKESTLTYGVNVAVDASLGNSFYLDITDNVAFNVVNPTNGAEGQTIRFVLHKSAAGIHAGITWGADYKQSWASGDIAAPAAATPYSVISFTRRGAGVWVEESRCENQS